MMRKVAISVFICALRAMAQGNVIPLMDCVERSTTVVRGTTVLASDAPAGSSWLPLAQGIPAGATVVINPGGANQAQFRVLQSTAVPLQVRVDGTLGLPHSAGELVQFTTPEFYTAYFGYFNLLSTPVDLAVGSIDNFFLPGVPNRGQPATFAPGLHRRTFAVSFLPTRDLIWILDSGQAVARVDQSMFCDTAPPSVKLETLSATIGATVTNQRLGTTDATGSGVAVTALPTSTGLGNNTLPIGLTTDITFSNLRADNGVIFGDIAVSPAAASRVYFYSLQVANASGVTGVGTSTLIAATTCPITVTPSALPAAVAGAPYTAAFSGTGQAGPFTFAVEGVLPAGLSLTSDGRLSGVPQQTGSFPLTLTLFAGSGCMQKTPYTLQVVGASCAATVTPQVQITLGGLRQNLANRHWLQTVTLRNGGTAPIAGPVALVLDNLSANAALSNASGVTSCAGPLGRPYLLVDTGSDGVLTPGESVSAALDFTNSNTAVAITYTPGVLAGGTTR